MRIVLTEPAERDLSSLDKKTQLRIRDALDKLLTFPQGVDLRKLKGTDNIWRLQVGDWRVILQPDRNQGILYVLRIRHRREAYRN